MFDDKEYLKISYLLNLIQKFSSQRDALMQQHQQTGQLLNELNGAIFSYNQLIAELEKQAKETLEEKSNKDLVKDPQGEKADDEANNKETQQIA
jgi:hypothetical protein